MKHTVPDLRLALQEGCLFAPQIPGGICNCSFYRLKTDGDHGDPYCGKPCRQKYPPANFDPVFIALKPFVHHPPGNREGNKTGDQYKL